MTSDCLCISDGDTTDGFFDPPSRTTPGTLCLSVAGKDLSEIYHTLAHEFSHLEQWVRDDALWVKWMKRSSRKSTLALERQTEEEALEIWGARQQHGQQALHARRHVARRCAVAPGLLPRTPPPPSTAQHWGPLKGQ